VVIHYSILLTMQRIIHIFLLLFRSSLVMTQVFPNNSENAIPLAYPTNCQVVSGIKTTRYISMRGKQYCTTVGSSCNTTQQCRDIAEMRATRLCPSRQGDEFVQCVDNFCRMKEQVEWPAPCDCLQGCQQDLGDYRSCFVNWNNGTCIPCIPCGIIGGKMPCCPPGLFLDGICTC